MTYIWENEHWPELHWVESALTGLLAHVSREQGRLLGKMEGLGFDLRNEAHLRTLTEDVVKSSEIEGEKLPPDQVRSSIARRLGLDVAGLVPADRNVDGVVEMMVDATNKYHELTKRVAVELRLVPEGIPDQARGAETVRLILRNGFYPVSTDSSPVADLASTRRGDKRTYSPLTTP